VFCVHLGVPLLEALVSVETRVSVACSRKGGGRIGKSDIIFQDSLRKRIVVGKLESRKRKDDRHGSVMLNPNFTVMKIEK